ncbi:MAG: four helix bundle protein [Candidatus Latescibacteria bacterium]|nr:four helix bundle protein [Candidatus Latescibacterota bacterium]
MENPKSETLNPKQYQTTKTQNSKPYDLEDRTLIFAKAVIHYCKNLPKTIINIELIKQLVRSSGSVGANYIEANESLGKKDFLMHVRISRKESKESRYWLELSEPHQADICEKVRLITETTE